MWAAWCPEARPVQLREGSCHLFFGAGAVISGIFLEAFSSRIPGKWAQDLPSNGRERGVLPCGICDKLSFNG